MIKEKFNKEHRRNKSELHSLPEPHQKVKKKEKGKMSKASYPKTMNSDMVHNLVAKSMRNVPQKQVIIEDIEDDWHDQENAEQFFRFGKRNQKGPQSSLPEIEQIVEVPDTGSYSQRNTENRPENKENLREFINKEGQAKMKISLQKLDHAKGKEAQSHRGFQNCSHRSQSRSSRSHNCSQSTVQLRTKSGKTKKKGGKGSNSGKLDELDRQVRLIWECIGEIWLKSKATEKVLLIQAEMAEENAAGLKSLSTKNRMNEKDLFDLKLMLSKRGQDWLQ